MSYPPFINISGNQAAEATFYIDSRKTNQGGRERVKEEMSKKWEEKGSNPEKYALHSATGNLNRLLLCQI